MGEAENIKFYLPKQFLYNPNNEDAIFYAFYVPYSLYLYDLKNQVSAWMYYGDLIPIAYSAAARYKSVLMFSGGLQAGSVSGWSEKARGVAHEAYSIDMRDYPKQRFSALHPMLSPRYQHTLDFVTSSCIVAVGGSCSVFPAAERYVNTCERYNVTINTWSWLPTLHVPKAAHVTCVFNQRVVYVFGGCQIAIGMLDVEFLDCCDEESGWTVCRMSTENTLMKPQRAIQSSPVDILLGRSEGDYFEQRLVLHQLNCRMWKFQGISVWDSTSGCFFYQATSICWSRGTMIAGFLGPTSMDTEIFHTDPYILLLNKASGASKVIRNTEWHPWYN